jgi:hypothetical protein
MLCLPVVSRKFLTSSPLLLLLLLASASLTQQEEAPADETDPHSSGVLAILNVSVISMTTTDLWSGQTVVIRGGRISEVAPREKALVPRGATRIDGTGKYLIPGLFDSHIHLQQDENTNRDLLTLFLVNGVTTVLNLYGTPLHLALRTAVDRGEIPGPRIFTSGRSVGAPHGQTPAIAPEEIAREVAAQKRAGYDFIKLHGDLSLEAYRRLMAASRQENMRVVGHAPRTWALRQCSKSDNKRSPTSKNTCTPTSITALTRRKPFRISIKRSGRSQQQP